MKIPTSATGLLRFTQDTVDECKVSIPSRRNTNRVWRRLYYTGQAADEPPKVNKCYTHIERLGSYLYSAADVRLSLDFQADDQTSWTDRSIAGARRVNRIWNRTKSGLVFGQGLRTALIDGCAMAKWVWKNGAPRPYIVRNNFFGVLREDLSDLSEQDAFTHTYYLTKSAFRRLIADQPNATEVMDRVASSFTPPSSEVIEDSYFHEIVAGGVQPISASATPTGQFGQVDVFMPPAPMLSPQVRSDLVRVDELWAWNDTTEDWSTIRLVDPGIIITNTKRLTNLCGIKGHQPFSKICPNEDPGYFFGRSELANLYGIQGLLNRRVNNVDRIFNLQANPPQAFSGFSGIDEEKKRAMLMAGGQIHSEMVNAKVENLAPTMPTDALNYITMIGGWFDEMAGFTPALLGEGEGGVRSSQQGQLLVRTGSPPIRERAFLVESQVSDFGNHMLALVREKDPTIICGTDGAQFTMSQLPNDVGVVVDSHTSSPAFSGDNMNMAFALRKAGAIDNADLLENVNFPRADQLAAKARERDKAQAKYIAEHPEVLGRQKPGPKPGVPRAA